MINTINGCLIQEAKLKKLESANKVDEEVVDFVIDNRSTKKTIDLPDRSEGHPSSPTKGQPAAASAPGKLKMRWLQASKWQEETVDSTVTQLVGIFCFRRVTWRFFIVSSLAK